MAGILLAEIPLPNEQARMEILKIHAAPIAKHGEIGLYDDIVHLLCKEFYLGQ
jgi:ATP-dependent 26S proteasome regulatory subunit